MHNNTGAIVYIFLCGLEVDEAARKPLTMSKSKLRDNVCERVVEGILAKHSGFL